MARIPLQTLPAFRAVARLGHMRAAAESLHLTHGAVSQQIKLHETQPGVELFHRRGRGIVLSPAGQALAGAVEQGLQRIELGVREAELAASGGASAIRLSAVPSFMQRWLLPRMPHWRERHPKLAIELHASQQLIDLVREGYHAAVRQGIGPWRGLQADRLIHSPLIAVGTPEVARRLLGRPTSALADEPLLGDAAEWQRFFALAGITPTVRPVATFNDAGLMLQAAEQGLGITVARDLLAADALRNGRLVRLSPIELLSDSAHPLWLVYPPTLQDWPPLVALREWLLAELAASQAELERLAAPAVNAAAGTAPADPTGSRSRAPSAARGPGRARRGRGARLRRAPARSR